MNRHLSKDGIRMEKIDMKCPNCGATVNETDAFCFQCGGAVEPSETATVTPSAPVEKAPPPKAYASEVRDFSYGGFWKRFAAWIIDVIILAVITVPISLLFGLLPYNPWSGWISWVITFFIGLAYYAFQESSIHQATLGKRALGIVVTDMEGKRITLGRAAGRELAKYISALTLGIGFLIIGFTEKKQGLHDLIAGCLVINK